ncbi:eukaryotic translation initiation factor 4 gamma-like [Macrobrachium rosenbergii]|uniref:eukaryotic translation initiation factor 4 gamma-like n=1 Tax=Macrobrachium rosenbergii TaxID=79674 RepID=UPI0034D3AA2C
MKVTRSAKKSAPTPGKIKRSLLAGPLLVAKENTNPSKSTKLLITNLDHNVTDSDICELFSEFGSIREVAVHYNCWGYSLGTAHVVFLNHDNAAEAARRYNGVPFDGRPMTITVEGAPHGAFGVQKTLPVKMRLSFGPNHMSNGRNPLSQVNVPTRGRPPKGLKRLESGPKGFGGLTKPRGRPAVLGNGKTVGRLPTAAELDMELDEYLSQKNKKAVVTKNKDKENDDFGYVNEVMIAGGVTPQRSAKKKRTPKGTPKTPGTSNASRTTPGKTPKRSPGRPPKRPLGRPPKKTPTGSPKVTPKTPGNQPGTTPFKVKLVRGPQKTPKKTETQEEEEVADPAETGVIAVEEPVEAEVTATAEDPNETETAAEEPIEEEAVAEEPTEEEAVAEEPTEEEAVAEEPTETDAAAEEPTEAEAAAEESEDDVVAITLDDEEAAVPPSKRTLKTPAKIKSQPAKKAVETPSRRRTTRAPSKTPSKTELAKKRKASDDEPLEEGEVSDNEETVLPDLPDLSKSAKKLNKRRSGRFAGSAN